MMPGTPTGTVARDWLLPPVDWVFWWLPGSRILNGKVMPDRAALIEAQIPGLRRFACALLRGDREARPTRSFTIAFCPTKSAYGVDVHTPH